MIIAHTSDTHGSFPDLGDADIIVHSGDLLPNWCPSDPTLEGTLQRAWIMENASAFCEWVGERPFLFVQGNHDFVNPCPTLRSVGVNAINLCTGTITEYAGLKWFGWQFVPTIGASIEWANERTEAQIFDMLQALPFLQDGPPDIFVSHCPIRGVLDECRGMRLGSVGLREHFEDPRQYWPDIVMHGHIHEDPGVKVFSADHRWMFVSNAAQRVYPFISDENGIYPALSEVYK